MHAEDRRVQRTKGRLRSAIASLIHEKEYGAIAVKEILARADVGRSAFYTHFRDKEELLVSALREAIRAAAGASTQRLHPADAVLAFSYPFLEQVEHVRRLDRHMSSPERFAPVHDCLRRVIAEHVESMLPRGHASRDVGATAMPTELVAAHVADTFLRVLTWWLQSDMPWSAREVDAFFRDLTRPVLAERYTA
jgi:AcrR family transcriptional regulator